MVYGKVPDFFTPFLSSSSPEETLPNEERLEDMRDHQGKTAYYWAKENGYSSIAGEHGLGDPLLFPIDSMYSAILPPMLYDVYGQMEQRKASTKVYDPSKKKAKSTDKKAGKDGKGKAGEKKKKK
eukprot:762853-Hanusia_phi.AAC.5